jgi:peptide/nickel transport system permease protein
MTGLIILGIIIMMVIPGRLFIYDKSKDANMMMLPIANRSPLFRCEVITLSREGETLQRIPIKKYKESNGLLDAVIWTEPEDTTELISHIEIQNGITYSISTHTFLLGTDRFGRDIMSRMIVGGQYTLAVGLLSVLIALLIGVFIGAVAGYYGGLTDGVLSWFMNVIWSLPTLLIVIALNLALGKGFWQVFLAIGLTMWVDVARIVRGQVMSLKQKEFVTAAHVLGFGDFRILFRHILPNCMSALIVITCSNFASAILLESGLSFLGFGNQPPAPSWGMMIKEHYAFLILHIPHLALIPGAAIGLLVLSVNLVGIGLRDVLDVKLR